MLGRKFGWKIKIVRGYENKKPRIWGFEERTNERSSTASTGQIWAPTCGRPPSPSLQFQIFGDPFFWIIDWTVQSAYLWIFELLSLIILLPADSWLEVNSLASSFRLALHFTTPFTWFPWFPTSKFPPQFNVFAVMSNFLLLL